MRHRIGRPRFMQSFASGGAGTPFAATTAVEVSFAPAGNISSTNVQAALQELDNEKVAKAGDTMTGFLVLNAPPVLDLQAATKKYVDDKVAAGGGYTDEMAMDAVAAMIKNGTNITWVYDDVLNSLTPTVNVTNMAAGSVGFTPAGNVGSNNVQAAIQELDNEKVAKAGDTMTGNLVIQKAAPRLSFDATDANGPYIEVKRNNVFRWFFYLAGDPETGSNVGSDFYIQCMNDAGGSVAFPLRIERKTGVVKLQEAIPSTSTTTGALQVAGGAGIAGAINTSGNLTIAKDNPVITLNQTGTVLPQMMSQKNGLLRWVVAWHAGVESSGNAGSDFSLYSFNDAGGSLKQPLIINRATSLVTLDGDLTVSKADAQIHLKSTAGTGAYITTYKANAVRWSLQIGNSAVESGSNAGSDFALLRFNDAGASIDAPLIIYRNTGNVAINSTTPSTSPTTGALTIPYGGVGIAGALYTGGIIVIAKSTPIFYMNDLGGAGNYISAQRNGLSRWEMSLGSGSEPGSNAGSDFVLNRYSDAGGLLGSAIVVRRNNGDTTINGGLTINSSSGLNINGGGFGVASADPTLYLQKAADANAAQMYVQSGGISRWLWRYADQTNNNMQLYRCNAAGGIVDGPFGVNWATGNVAMSSNIPATSSTTGTLTVAGGLGVGGNIYSGAMIHSPSGITVSPSLPDTNHSMTFDAGINGPFISGFLGVALGIQGVKSLTITGSGQEMNLGTPIAGYKFGMTFPGGGTQYGFGIKQSADTTVAIQFINAGGGNMGNISTGTTTVSYNTSSDKRLKKNLKKFDSNKIIDKIEVYDFEWKETGERGLGVIAQDVYEVYPQAITHDERDDNWFVDYSKFAPLMLQELKSLRARVGKIEKSTNHRRGV